VHQNQKAQKIPVTRSLKSAAGASAQCCYAIRGVAMAGGDAIAGIGVGGASGGDFDKGCARTANAKAQDRMK
jgi:hypothetical protein